MNKGALIIISGPSGSGKDTVLKELFKKMPEIEFSVSSVTRNMREGEIEGEKYNFVSREKFESMIVNIMSTAKITTVRPKHRLKGASKRVER